MTCRDAPPIRQCSRFEIGDRAGIINTLIAFEVVAVSEDGEIITGASGATYHARQCVCLARPKRLRARVA